MQVAFDRPRKADHLLFGSSLSCTDPDAGRRNGVGYGECVSARTGAFFAERGYRFNLKHDPARFFTERAAADGKSLSVCMNMLAYDCRDPIRPYKTADGKPASVNPVFTDRSSVVSTMPKTRFIR